MKERGGQDRTQATNELGGNERRVVLCMWSVCVFTVGSELCEVLYDVVCERVVVINHQCDTLLAVLSAIVTSHSQRRKAERVRSRPECGWVGGEEERGLWIEGDVEQVVDMEDMWGGCEVLSSVSAVCSTTVVDVR